MNEGHRLHEAQIPRAGIEPSGAFTVEARDAPDGVALLELAGELDIAATSAVRSHVDEAAGRRGVVLDLSRASFVDSSMLKELLRANAELERYGTRLVLAASTPAVRRVLDLTRTAGLFTLAEDRDAALALLDAA
jgi:stage II sporulation protein AA (anti-sigma F factor antagonist)